MDCSLEQERAWIGQTASWTAFFQRGEISCDGNGFGLGARRLGWRSPNVKVFCVEKGLRLGPRLGKCRPRQRFPEVGKLL